MDYTVVFKESFARDLEECVRRIAEQDPIAAERFGIHVFSRAKSLAVFPERFPRVRQRPGIRRFIVYRHFKIFYRIDPTLRRVEVLRLWDGRREDLPRTS
jgi:plasmid stabilization system protein ParE